MHLGCEFELSYQPIVNVQINQVSCCEALLRWHHPERGTILPAEFIPVAEDTGLMVPIGEWALRQACTDATAWPNGIRVAVNVSPVQLRNETWSQIVVGALAVSESETPLTVCSGRSGRSAVSPWDPAAVRSNGHLFTDQRPSRAAASSKNRQTSAGFLEAIQTVGVVSKNSQSAWLLEAIQIQGVDLKCHVCQPSLY